MAEGTNAIDHNRRNTTIGDQLGRARDQKSGKTVYNGDHTKGGEDGEIDTLLGDGERRQIEIVRCCIRMNEPYMRLKSEKCEILLPMPANLKSTELPSWEGEAAGKISTLIAGAEGAMDTIQDAIKAYGEKAGGDGSWIEGLKSAATSIFGQNADWGTISKMGLSGDLNGIAMRAGVAVLPPKELRFQGLSFRTFNFDWKLIPLDQKQSKEIEKTIYKLQYNSLPGAAAGVVSYPYLWDISFGPVDPHHIMYIKTCACTNITVDYSGAGRSVFHTKDLWPIVVNLSLSFTEQTLHSREDVANGIYG